MVDLRNIVHSLSRGCNHNPRSLVCRFITTSAFVCLLAVALTIVSCGPKSGYFKIEGHLLNLNKGEFYVYSQDHLVNGLDTIRVEGGRFSYERPCPHEGVLMLVFPNFSEHPIFATPGKSVKIKADASHLKEMTVKGTEANEEMTSFRQQIVSASPPEIVRRAEQFIKDHPQSPVSIFLLKKFFLLDKDVHYPTASSLADFLLKAQPQNSEIVKIQSELNIMQRAALGKPLPSFSATDIYGRKVNDSDLRGKVSVVHVWSSWNYESQDVQRRIKRAKTESGNKLGVLGISLDGNMQDCKNMLRYDSLQWATVCDELMFESPLMEKFGLQTIPDNIIYDVNGKIVARGLNAKEMQEQLEKMLK